MPTESRGHPTRARAAAPKNPETGVPAGRRRSPAELLERAAAEAKASKWIESALTAGEAMRVAHAARDYERVGEAAERAREARKRIKQSALKAKAVQVVASLGDLGVTVNELGVARCDGLKGGCYLLEAPGCVGVDGRTLRDLCEQAGKSALIVVSEPATRAGLLPVVAVGPVTVRARVGPPKGKGATPDWCAQAIDALGDSALEASEGETAADRVEALVEHAESVPECEALYEALIEASANAAREAAMTPPAGRRKRSAGPARDDDDAGD